ncbi:MAG: heavy metal response regulator transcription factor [Proteobacteria bacterium]|nr:heavy metal response regulator transcription factor [Pseudomonadota bacterium]
MRILIVEDEKKIATQLQQGLTENGYTVSVSHDGQDGLFQAKTIAFDLIILDIMLPILDGIEVLRRLREIKKDLRILLLTAKDKVEDRVKGLELGADDYLVKPFAFSELLARVRSLLRRGHVTEEPLFQLADLQIDFLKHKVKRGDTTIQLTSKEFNLLCLFARHQSEVLSRTYIMEQVWDINLDCDSNVIDMAVLRLRQKLDDNFSKKLIHTIRGSGYVFEER